jgi:hypothetical protein
LKSFLGLTSGSERFGIAPHPVRARVVSIAKYL